MKNVSVSAADLKELKDLYLKAKKEQENSFFWKDREILTSFAKYMVEYLEEEFKKVIL